MHLRLCRILTITTVALLLSTAAHAQPGSNGQVGPPPGRHSRPSPAAELDQLRQVMQAAAVPLSDTQSATILGILEDRNTALKALRKSDATPDAAATQRDQLMAASRASIRAVLTEGQVRVFDALPAEPGRGGPPAGAPPSGGANAPSTTSESIIDANTGGDPRTAAF